MRYVVFASSAMLSAEQTSRIGGVVTDQSAAVIPEARVILIDDISKLKFDKTTDANGRFTFSDVEPGTYSLEALHVGFKTTIVKHIKIGSNASIELPPIMLIVIDPFPNGCGEFLGLPKIQLEKSDPEWTGIMGSVVSYPGMAPFRGSTVTATNADDPRAVVSTMTDRHGEFQLKNLKPGLYYLITHSEGYADFILDDIMVKLNRRTQISSPLELRHCPQHGTCFAIKEVHEPTLCL